MLVEEFEVVLEALDLVSTPSDNVVVIALAHVVLASEDLTLAFGEDSPVVFPRRVSLLPLA